MVLDKKILLVILILIILLVISAVISLSVGSAKVSVISLLTGNLEEVEKTIIYQIRLPRIIVSAMVGMGLALSGVVFQSLFKNAMAGPYIIGISSGASLGVAVAVGLGLEYYLYGISSKAIFAFIGAILATFFIYKISMVNGKVPIETLLLSGVAVNFFLSALVSFLMILDENNLQKVFYWLLGTLSRSSWKEVWILSFPLLISFFILYYLSSELNILLLGEVAAYHLGVNVEKIKIILLGTASLITAISVSASGTIAFIGLVVPHVLRLLLGADHKMLLPSSALGGAVLLIVTDTLARTLLEPMEIPVGIITSLIGAPFFLYLLSRKKLEI